MKNKYVSAKRLVALQLLTPQMVILIILVCSIFSKTFAQKKYFQQEVNYKINVILDDKKHQLSGTIDMNYHNNAPDPLSMLYILLQPNAYQSKNSAFAKQLLRNGSTRFYFAEQSEMGKLADMNFEVDGKKVEVEMDKDNPDVAKVKLNTPIPSGESVKITTPFTYNIPFPFSRGGHAGQQYLMTQWYPRPAVYDAKGWHPQPYLDQGEFYQEFGSFDVSITLPENYVVGATGMLQTASEIDFLTEKIKYTEGVLLAKDKNLKNKDIPNDSFPPSSERSKTIRYKADKVIDFAWFADKRFLVSKSSVKLNHTGRNVDSYAFYPPKYAAKWSKSTEYINRALKFYSDAVGDYPHPQASAVMSDEGVGGGMEYPMITVLSGNSDAQQLDETITHEVGHNWFQGILASNERDFPYLDEGLNSYYDHRYTSEYYSENTNRGGVFNFFLKKSDYNFIESGEMLYSFLHKDQAPTTASERLTSSNYGLAVYEKTAASLKILEKHLGRDKFDEIMQDYFKQWQFKHPQPEDFKKMWTDAATDVGDISWLFDGLLGSTQKVDYKITKLIDNDPNFWHVEVKNVEKIATPFTVSALNNRDSAVYTIRLSGIDEGKKTEVLIPKRRDVKTLTIDNKHYLPDANRQNNTIRTSGLFPRIEPIHLSIIPHIDNSKWTNLYAVPAFGTNVYDGAMLGLWLNNGLLPLKKWEMSVVPMYGFKSKTWVGLGNVSYLTFLGDKKITFGIGVRRFDFDYNEKFSVSKIYERYSPSVKMEFGGERGSNFSQKIELRHIFLRQQGFVYDSVGQYSGKKFDNSNITELSYSFFLKNVLSSTSFRTALETQQYVYAGQNQNYLKSTFELKNDLVYQKGRHFFTRIFVGGFLKNTGRNATNFYDLRSRGSLGLSSRGLTDYRYDDLWLGRSEQTGLPSQQIDPTTEGGMKFTLPNGSTTAVGFSNSFIAAANFSFDLPIKLPAFLRLNPYFDLGYFSDNAQTSSKILASGGIQWNLFGNALSIYVPVYFSGKPLAEDPNSFRALMSQRGNFLDRITFSLKLTALNPQTIIQKIAN